MATSETAVRRSCFDLAARYEGRYASRQIVISKFESTPGASQYALENAEQRHRPAVDDQPEPVLSAEIVDRLEHALQRFRRLHAAYVEGDFASHLMCIPRATSGESAQRPDCPKRSTRAP
jgi:hypothetical protein